MSADDDLDPAIRVHVSPSQASYFAGEQFAVAIAFTNTRTPESPKVRHAHKRAVHSISSAPLARPPTSPGIPAPRHSPALSAPSPAPAANNGRDMPARKRLVGQTPGKLDMSTVLEQKRRSLLEKSRSLSIDIPAAELLGGGGSASRYVRAYDEFSDAGLPSTPMVRSPDFQLPPHHPHVRKQSVTDVHIHVNDRPPAPPPTPPSGLASSSTSTFSLSLDPIEETPTPYSGSPLPRSPSLTDALDQRLLKSTAQPQPRRPPQLGLGHGPPPADATPSLRNGALVSSNSELILYSYAQLLGTVSIAPLPGAVMTPDHAQTLAALRRRLSKRTVVGGGSMDITSHQRIQERRRSHGRSASLTSSFFSLLSPSVPSTPLPASQSWAPPARSRTPSLTSSATNGQQGDVGLGLINGGTDEDVDPDAPLPTFDVQPAMLAVDLMLGPGESRTYTYTVSLPENLPPTFRGRTLKFSYELVIGTCRASASAMRSSSSLGPTGANSVSRVMKVPIRVYNHVAVGTVPRPYDLLWPVGKRILTMESAPRVVEGASTGVIKLQSNGSFRALPELRRYGLCLLNTFGDPGRNQEPDDAGSPLQADMEREREEGGLTGCREAVEILTRNPKKVSYDVNKDGVKVAVLTFTKSAYRLGETVLGVVELNERQGRSRVLSLSAMLESQETLPSQIASAGNVGQMRRVHAEHHASMVSSVLRTTFSLDIPSDASPGFQVGLGTGVGGGLHWRVRLSLLVAVAGEMDAGGVRLKQLVRDGPTGEWGTSYKAHGSIAPKERGRKGTGTSWVQFFLGGGGEEEEWSDVGVETVECEVPMRVWPGNTAFKAMEVVFDV